MHFVFVSRGMEGKRNGKMAENMQLLLPEGLTLQTKERRALPMYVTYTELIQIGIFIVALIILCYQIFKSNSKRK